MSVETEIIPVENLENQEDADKLLSAIEHIWGLSKADINLAKKEAIVTYDERMASSQDFAQAIVEMGFVVSNEKG